MKLITAAALLFVACAPSNTAVPTPEPTNSVAQPTPAPSPTPTASTPVPDPAPMPPPAVKYAEGFATPECALHDAAADRYLVSNINGNIFAADNNGYISELSPDGTVTKAKWIEGGQNKVTLNAPKGMAITQGVLFVADLDVVRLFDAKTGAPKGEVKLEGATFANDVAATADGKVYVSDSGLAPDGDKFKPSGTDAVWLIVGGKAKALGKSPDLGRPNGLLIDGKDVWVVTFGTGELFSLDPKGAKQKTVKLPKGSLDGILKVDDMLIVSSWEASTIYRGKPDGTFEPIITNVSAPADLGYDAKRKRILVPRFMSNTVEAYALP